MKGELEAYFKAWIALIDEFVVRQTEWAESKAEEEIAEDTGITVDEFKNLKDEI